MLCPPPPSYVALWDSKTPPQTCQWEGFLVFGNLSFRTPSLGWVSIPNSFVSLFIFYILSYLLLETMGCLSGCLVSSSISIQNLFCGIFSVFKWCFDEFVGEKVVSPSYSSAILGPPPPPPAVYSFKTAVSMSVLFLAEPPVSNKNCMPGSWLNAQQRFDALILDIAIDFLSLLLKNAWLAVNTWERFGK